MSCADVYFRTFSAKENRLFLALIDMFFDRNYKEVFQSIHEISEKLKNKQME